MCFNEKKNYSHHKIVSSRVNGRMYTKKKNVFVLSIYNIDLCLNDRKIRKWNEIKWELISNAKYLNWWRRNANLSN